MTSFITHFLIDLTDSSERVRLFYRYELKGLNIFREMLIVPYCVSSFDDLMIFMMKLLYDYKQPQQDFDNNFVFLSISLMIDFFRVYLQDNETFCRRDSKERSFPDSAS